MRPTKVLGKQGMRALSAGRSSPASPASLPPPFPATVALPDRLPAAAAIAAAATTAAALSAVRSQHRLRKVVASLEGRGARQGGSSSSGGGAPSRA